MKKTLIGIWAIAALAVAVSAFAGGAGKKSYIVLMADSPALTYEGDIQGLPATKPGKGHKINPRSAQVQNYTNHLKKAHKGVLAAVGAAEKEKTHSYTIALNGFAAKLTDSQARAVSKQPGVLKVLPDRMKYKTTDSSPAFLGLTAPGGPWLKGYTGENVVVGVIDTGIWPEHPSFADDGTYGPSPVGAVPCEFGNTAHNSADAPFACNNKLLGARQMLDTYRALIGADPDEYDSARDNQGHGTHTTATAAGNYGIDASLYGVPLGIVSGIAPRARIIAYKALGKLGGFSSDLAAAIDQAAADGVDVINYSVGGGAAGPGADEIAFLFADDAGVFSATSAGNSGPAAGTLDNPGTMPWITAVGASTQSRFFEGRVYLGNGSEFSGASITLGTEELALVDAEFAGGDLCLEGTLDPNIVAGKIVLCRRGSNSRVGKSYAVYEAGGAGMIMYNTSDDGDLASDTHWVPTVQVDYTPGLAIKAYIASAPAPTAKISGGQIGSWPWAPSMAAFSSRGPNPVAPDIIKPDVIAPGVQVLAGYSPTPLSPEYPGELFAALQGTSMSSPHVAGVFALLKQAHPDWSPAMARSALMTTAYQDVVDNDRLSTADPFDMGAGHISSGGKWAKGSVGEPGLAYDAGLFEYAAFTCGQKWGVFSAGSCDFLESIGVPTDPSDLNLASMGIAELPVSQTIQRTVTSVATENGWRTYTVSVEAPAGYSVTVEPATLRLKRGQSAVYQLTIATVDAPAGEWRFGSLTWRDETGNYAVRSPIAVSGALFSAPEEIEGSGVDGSAEFTVAFGYTGAYAAAAHGLEPATVISDTVVQDPDQTFAPGDGYSNLHHLTLSGAAYFRIIMPPDATEADADLDIFVFDPDGNLAASSTRGGTDEQIDIVLPMDGTWSVYVHGWAAPGGDSDYDMYVWVISATPGGILTIDAAPTSAVIGTMEPVGVSWIGATAGQWHLGAVSHTGDAGLMGLTLINVDNR